MLKNVKKKLLKNLKLSNNFLKSQQISKISMDQQSGQGGFQEKANCPPEQPGSELNPLLDHAAARLVIKKGHLTETQLTFEFSSAGFMSLLVTKMIFPTA